MSVTWGGGAKTVWPDMSKDLRAEALAKVALGWEFMSNEQKMDNTRRLIARAQEIKASL